MYMIRGTDRNMIFGYISKITKIYFQLDDSCYALKFKTKAEAQRVIKKLKNTGTELHFCAEKTME